VKIDAAHAIAHNDEKNAENLLVIKDKTLAEKYIKNWAEHGGAFGSLCGESSEKVKLSSCHFYLSQGEKGLLPILAFTTRNRRGRKRWRR